METKVTKTENGYNINITQKDSSFDFSNISREKLKELRGQINAALEESKGKVRIWNPRSRRHDIIEQ
jgi:hypothetical protein